jgi:sugar phosphate isomerase/epimerase
MNPISLAHLTVIDTPPPTMVRMAAGLGYDHVGLRLIRVTDTTPGYPLMDDPMMLRDTCAAIEATGITVLDIEFLRLTPEFDVAAYGAFLDAGAVLGARHVICAPYDPDLGRLSDSLATLDAACAPRGLRPVLEFFPWTNVPDLATAARVVADVPRAGILIDALHFDRGGSLLADIVTLHHRLPFLHLCDAPVLPAYTTDVLLHAGRAERLAPGDGQIDLPALLRAMPPGIPLALEIPMTARRLAQGSAAVAAHAIARTRDFLRAIA